MPDTLRNKSVLITGGSRGIGRAIALRLALETPLHIGIGYCHDDAAANRTVADVEALGIPCSASGLMLGRRIASTSYSMSLPVGWVNWMCLSAMPRAVRFSRFRQ